MLHRMALRVLPRLTLAVTEPAVRRRKRVVMLAPGLVAFGVYRLAKQGIPLTEPLTLLALSGLVSAATAVWAYRRGRQAPLTAVWREDGPRRAGWLIGWIGFAYGMQLSLLVLALLKVVVGYDFFRHPDGPAMMAIIIACTSVARDAFEIGHVRRLQVQGQPVLTFPDGVSLRALVREQPGRLARWALLPAMGCAGLALATARLGEIGQAEIGQLVAVSLFAASATVWAYLAGKDRSSLEAPRGGWPARLRAIGWSEVFRFWWWPGLAFAATYHLVLVGGLWLVLRLDATDGAAPGLIAGAVGGLMAVYGYYLGHRRGLEDRVHQAIPGSLLRCPFVMDILGKAGVAPNRTSASADGLTVGDMGRRS